MSSTEDHADHADHAGSGYPTDPRTDRPGLRAALLGTLLLLGAICALAWLGLRTGHLALSPHPTAVETTTPQATPSQRPTGTPAATPTAEPTLAVIPTDPELAAAFAQQAAALGGQYALAWVDAEGLHVLGTAADDIAWSTIKVPLSIAALEHSGQPALPQIASAITVSDNDAARSLWSSLGQPEEAASAVDEVLHAYNSAGTRTESQTVRPPFTPFGQTVWSVQDQARFAAALSCAPPARAGGQVRALMARVSPDQRWGFGELEAAHLKGGWGPQEDGGYVARQLGDVTINNEVYAWAGSARARDGDFGLATSDLSALANWWADEVVPGRTGLACALSEAQD